MEPLNEEIDQLREQLADWRIPFTSLTAELEARKAAIATAARTLKKEVP